MKRILLFILLLMIPAAALAHPGGTDSNGGHYDRSTGKYHYHHGYSAHQHTDGVCPYDYDDRTGQNSGSSSASQNISTVKQSLSIGDRGVDVKALQSRLSSLGYQVGTIDGIFGAKTEAAVSDYQKDMKMSITGIADQFVLKSLFPESVKPAPSLSPIPEQAVTKSAEITHDESTRTSRASGNWIAFAICAIIIVPYSIFLFGFIRIIASSLNESIRMKIAHARSAPGFRQRLELKRADRKHSAEVCERRAILLEQRTKATTYGYQTNYTDGLAYINRYGEDGSFHNSAQCCPGNYSDIELVSAHVAKQLGLTRCAKCSNADSPSGKAYVMISASTISLYHSCGSSCLAKGNLSIITLDDAKQRKLSPCSRCYAPRKNPEIWF